MVSTNQVLEIFAYALLVFGMVFMLVMSYELSNQFTNISVESTWPAILGGFAMLLSVSQILRSFIEENKLKDTNSIKIMAKLEDIGDSHFANLIHQIHNGGLVDADGRELHRFLLHFDRVADLRYRGLINPDDVRPAHTRVIELMVNDRTILDRIAENEADYPNLVRLLDEIRRQLGHR